MGAMSYKILLMIQSCLFSVFLLNSIFKFFIGVFTVTAGYENA